MIVLKKIYLFRAILVVLIAVTLIFIWSNSLADADKSREMSGSVVEIVKPIIDPQDKIDDDPFVNMVRKAAHFTEFALLGAELYLLFQTFERWSTRVLPSFLLMLGIAFACAVTDELLQLTSEGRACLFTDMLIDLAGITTGAMIVLLIVLIAEHTKKTAGN